MRIEIQDIATGQSIHSEVVESTGETAREVAEWTLSNQTVNREEPETIQVVVWLDSDMGDVAPDVVLAGKPAAYTLVSAVPGDLVNGVEISDPASPLSWADLPEDARTWANAQGYGGDDELLYVVPGEQELTGWPTRVVTA